MVKLTAKDVAWIIDRPVTGEDHDDESVTVTDGTREMKLELSSDGGKLTFNGQYVDVGDDLFEYLGVMDEIERYGHSRPYDDDEI